MIAGLMEHREAGWLDSGTPDIVRILQSELSLLGVVLKSGLADIIGGERPDLGVKGGLVSDLNFK